MIDLTKSVNWDELVPNNLETENPIYLFEFAGSIGSGKSDSSEELAKVLKSANIEFVELREDIISNDTKQAIDDFYSGKSKSPSELERIICGRRMQMLLDVFDEHKKNDSKATVIVSDRAVIEDIRFILSLMNRTEDQDELNKLGNIVSNIQKFAGALDDITSAVMHTIYYLDCDIPTALERIERRGRPNEKQIDARLLLSLTTPADDCVCRNVVKIDNCKISARNVATISAVDLLSRILDYDQKILVSFYGVPGCGKTFAVKYARKMFGEDSSFWKEHCGMVIDDSDEDYIKEVQRKVYEDDIRKLTPDDIQEFIDKRRIKQFSEERKCDGIVFTDIGPETSNVFRRTTACKQDFSYRDALEKQFKHFVNVILIPKDENFNVVRNHIKERGRPGEYQWFTVDRLNEINDAIWCCAVNKVEFHCHTYIVICVNEYNEESSKRIFEDMMGALRNAIIGHAIHSR